MSTPCGVSSPPIAASTGEAEVRVGIIGCGLVGQKRARALGEARLVACADAATERAEVLARATPNQPEVLPHWRAVVERPDIDLDRKSTRLNSSHGYISYAVFCLKKKKINTTRRSRYT